MRSMWKGAIGWGMVNVPIKLFKATEDHDLKSHMVHAHDKGRVKMPRVCQECGEVVEAADLLKMYETEDGVAYLTDEDLAELDNDEAKQVEVLEFVNAADIDPMMYEEAYYVGPDGAPAAKSYTLLTRALAQTERVAVARLTLRSKTHLAVLRVIEKGDALMIQTLRWPDEVRQCEFPAVDTKALTTAQGKVTAAELKMAKTLIEDMSNEWNPDRYQDTYRGQLSDLIASRVVDTPEMEEATKEVGDLLAKLEASKSKTRKPKSRNVPA